MHTRFFSSSFIYLKRNFFFSLEKKRKRLENLPTIVEGGTKDESFIIVYSSPQSICAAAAAGTLAGPGGGHALLLKD